MRILVTGASGLLGSRVVRLASEKHEVWAGYSENPVDVEGVETLRFDITDREHVFRAVRESEADAVIHCAAMTNVDDCERLPEKAFAVNGFGTENMAMAAREIGAKLIYVSTDYIFDGSKQGAYSESDEVSPLSVYAKSKLRGELGARIAGNWAVARVSVLYGWNSPKQHPNFVTWVIGKLKAGEEITLLSDQFISPTLAENAAEALLRIAEIGARGVFHVSGSSCISRLEFGRQIAREFGLDEGLISEGKSSEMKWLAKRPVNSCLSIEKAANELGVRMLSTTEGLKFMKKQLIESEAEGWTL